MIIMLYLLSGFTSWTAFLAAAPTQDLIPQWGMLLLLFLFPVVVFSAFVYRS